MQNVICPHCRENVVVPDDLAQAHCVRCGEKLTLETNITAQAPAAQPEPYLERESSRAPFELPEHYADWDEFRSLSPAIHRELMHMASRPLPDLRAILPAPLPDDAPDEVREWGRPLGTLDLSHGSFQQWLVIGVLLMGLGFLMTMGAAIVLVEAHNAPPGKAARRFDKDTAGGYVVIFGFGIGSLVGGAYCLAVRTRRRPTTIWLFEKGIFLQHHTGFKLFQWDEILNFEVVKRRGNPIYWLRFTEQISVRIVVGTNFETLPLMEYAEIRLCSSQFLQRLRAIFGGEREEFGILKLDRNGIEAPRFFAPWSEVRRVITDAKCLYVDWILRPNWVPVPYQDVSFPYLVVALASVLIDEQKRLPASK